MKVILHIISVELIFALFLLSGTLKGILFMIEVQSIPDLTLVTSIMLSIIIILNHKKMKSISLEAYVSMLILIILFIFMIISITYTSSPNYSIKKTIYFSLILLSMLLPIAIKKFDINKFMLIFSFIIFSATLLYLKFLFEYINGTLITNLTQSEIILARGMYLGVSLSNGIICLYYFFNKSSNRYKFLFVCISFLFIILAGGRGSLIATFLIILFYLILRLFLNFKTLKLKKNIFFSLIVFSIIILVLFFNNLDLINRTMLRLGMLIGGDSASVRMEYLNFAFEKINDSPIFGFGIGSFGIEYTGMDIQEHPHNVFIEIWFELGLLSILLFLFFNLIVLRSIIESKYYWCLALYVYLFFDMLKSSSLIDLRLMIGFFGIFLMINMKKKENE